MKKSIHTLQDALTYVLQKLYYAETKVKKEFAACSRQISDEDVKTTIKKYADSSGNRLLQLERIFNYLMQDPVIRKNEVIDQLVAETHRLVDSTTSPHLKDILMISCAQNINTYKIASYKTAYLFAGELELDTPTDLLQQILEEELDVNKSLSAGSIREFNKFNTLVKDN